VKKAVSLIVTFIGVVRRSRFGSPGLTGRSGPPGHLDLSTECSGIPGHPLSWVTTTDIAVEDRQKSPVKAVNPRKKP
jgi:hypothetical protein